MIRRVGLWRPATHAQRNAGCQAKYYDQRRVHAQHIFADPADQRRDLLVAQAAVVLELLDADRLVDVPGRHQALGDLGLDATRIFSRILVGQEGHRRDRVRLVAHLAFLLEDRRDVLAERHRATSRLLFAPGLTADRENRDERESARDDDRPHPFRPCHDSLPSIC